MNEAVLLLEENEFDPKTINLAGKQRMLSQKMVKEMLNFMQGNESAETLAATSTLFDKTLKGLIVSGTGSGLKGTSNGVIIKKLQNVETLWNSFHKNINTILTNVPSTSISLAYVSENNITLLNEMNKAVGMYEEQSSSKMVFLLWLTAIIGIVIVSVIIAAWIIIVMPLIRSLKDVIQTMSEGASQITAASDEVSSASQSVASGATEQAGSIEETTSSIEEVATMVKQNAQNANEAAILVDTCSTSAENGHVIVEEMNFSMAEINESNKKIADIINVIDSIAFQTNLLALNAAVEAARAGEHGKGFAVVAEEVRNLAQRSASAAKDTSALIEDSVTKANNGAALSAKCQESLAEIVENVKKVTRLTKDIAEASTEQSKGIDNINLTIQSFEQTIQQNAANAEETASASEQLSAQAQTLMHQVGILSLQVGEDISQYFTNESHGSGNEMMHLP